MGHTMSPFIHNKLFKISGTEAEYSAMDISPEDFGKNFPRIKELSGCNLTIPHKSAVIPFLDSLSPEARLFGAVNTVKFGEKAVGYNTDCTGFLKAIESADIPLKGKVLLLGNGGAARMMAFESAKAGCELTVGVRESGILKAEKIKSEIENAFKGAAVKIALTEKTDESFNLLLNATPCGMFPNTGVMPLSDTLLSKCENVFDCIYNPKETLLLKKAKANGSETGDGMPMLVWQAAEAQRIWNGVSFSEDEINAVAEEATAEMERIFR